MQISHQNKVDKRKEQEDLDNLISPLKIVVAGHVDDGKSTLIGRLLYETDSLPEGKLEELKILSSKRGMQLEWSFVLDAFQAERDQAITIDTSHIQIKLPDNDAVFIDAPGHIEFLKNMVSGAANADVALLLVDATQGVREQTRRHAYLLHFLGVHQIIVMINKMDLVDFAEDRFDEISKELQTYLSEIGVTPHAIIPISARHGDNLTTHSDHLSWYAGPTVLEAMNHFIHFRSTNTGPLRFPVQDIYKFDDRRIIAGRIESGNLKVGDLILFSPSGQTAHVQSIESWHAPALKEAVAKQSVGITLDKQIFIERGEIISHVTQAPILTTVFRATLFWLNSLALEQGKSYKMKLATLETTVTVQAVEQKICVEKLTKSKANAIELNECGEIILRTRSLIPVDEYQSIIATGRFVLIDDYEIVAGGMISMEGYPDQRVRAGEGLNLTSVSHHVTKENRIQRHGHKGGVLWFTGLSGAGKSTLAMHLEQRLFQKGFEVYTLDGDNIRRGLNSNLGFSPEDRMENIRRIGEVATLFADAGFICITAFISPYQEDRERVRKILPSGDFHEVYIKADLATCESRDTKGLYKKARAGEIAQFTGISSPYEVPLHPELIIDTSNLNIDQSIQIILEYVQKHFAITEIEQPKSSKEHPITAKQYEEQL